MNRKDYWEQIYQNKNFTEVSWYQAVPKTSIDFLKTSKIPKTAKIIDIGGGESQFVNYLLEKGYKNITVLDISANAIDKKKAELGKNANKIKWIVDEEEKIKKSSFQKVISKQLLCLIFF